MPVWGLQRSTLVVGRSAAEQPTAYFHVLMTKALAISTGLICSACYLRARLANFEVSTACVCPKRCATEEAIALAGVLQLSVELQQDSRCRPQHRRHEAALPGARLRSTLVRAPGNRAGCQRRSQGLLCTAQSALTLNGRLHGGSADTSERRTYFPSSPVTAASSRRAE